MMKEKMTVERGKVSKEKLQDFSWCEMGSAISWIRGAQDDKEKELRELDVKIDTQKERLKGYVAHHSMISSVLWKVFALVEVALISWYWLRTRPVDVLSKVVDTSFLILWPFLCWGFKKIVDTYYEMRIRRDETYMRELFDQQVQKLKDIENDPDFRRKLDLLMKYGKNIPSYSVPLAKAPVQQAPAPKKPSQPQVPPPQPQQPPQQRVVASSQLPKPVKSVSEERRSEDIVKPVKSVSEEVPLKQQQQQEEEEEEEDDKKTDQEPVPPRPSTPKTPKTYLQPVARTPLSARPKPVVLTPSKMTFLQSLMDLVVGDTPKLSVALVCSKCKANNGLVPQDEVPDLFRCKVCDEDNEPKKQ